VRLDSLEEIIGLGAESHLSLSDGTAGLHLVPAKGVEVVRRSPEDWFERDRAKIFRRGPASGIR
jgi:hypothetical protein